MPLRAAVGRPGGRLRRDRRVVDVRFVPAGHVLGSAQIVLEHRGERVVVSGDYKRRPDPTCPCFVPVPCDISLLKRHSAFAGLSPSRHRERDRPAAPSASFGSGALRWSRLCASKAQRIITELRQRGYHEPVYLHGALERLRAASMKSLGSSLASFVRRPARPRTS